MKQRNEFSRNEQQEQNTQHHAQSQSHVEFATVEELLREDRKQTPVPPDVTTRLRESLGAEPVPRRSWWKRMFGK